MEFNSLCTKPQLMKHLYPTLPILFLIAVCASCNEDPAIIQKKASVDFTLSSDGDQRVTAFPPDSRLVLSIQTQSGQPVMEFEEVGFVSNQDHFSTKPLDIPYGNYVITDLMIVDNDDNILYAAPKVEGALAPSVAHPLGFSFAFSPDAGVDAMQLRLLDVRRFKPGDFGYASFRKPGRHVNIMITGEDTNKPMAARGFIVSAGDTIARYKLDARMNQISLPLRADKKSQLIVSKEGYASARFDLSALHTGPRSPLHVSLTPAFTMMAFVGSGATFEFYLDGPEGAMISVDWGDGTNGSFALNTAVNIVHPYAAAGNYPIAITGEIGKITNFHSYYGYAMVDAFDFTRLTGLKSLEFGLTRSPATIDLRHNTNLERVELIGLDKLKAVHLPEKNHISSVALDGPNGLTTHALDAVIGNVYRNAVAGNIRGGSFSLAGYWGQEEGDETLVGPPSPKAMTSLRSLKEEYGWGVYPDPFD